MRVNLSQPMIAICKPSTSSGADERPRNVQPSTKPARIERLNQVVPVNHIIDSMLAQNEP